MQQPKGQNPTALQLKGIRTSGEDVRTQNGALSPALHGFPLETAPRAWRGGGGWSCAGRIRVLRVVRSRACAAPHAAPPRGGSRARGSEAARAGRPPPAWTRIDTRLRLFAPRMRLIHPHAPPVACRTASTTGDAELGCLRAAPRTLRVRCAAFGNRSR